MRSIQTTTSFCKLAGFTVVGLLICCGLSSAAIAQDAVRLDYGWVPGQKHQYEIDVEYGEKNDQTKSTGTVTYQLSGSNVREDLDGDPLESEDEGEATATAFAVSTDGYLLTCAHCVRGANKVIVYVEKKEFVATIVEVDHELDLAVIKIDAEKLPTVTLGKERKLELAQDVRAIGYPLSDVLGNSVKVTRGSVAGFIEDENVRSIQVDAAINFGNSGGPLADETGTVVGVVNAKLSGERIANVGFTVPIDYACEMLDRHNVQYQSKAREQVLTGVQLAKEITPAVFFIRTEMGPGGSAAPNYRLAASGSLNRKGKNEVVQSSAIISHRGEAIDFKEDVHLPMLLGPVCLMPIEKLPGFSSKQWTDQSAIILPMPKSKPRDRNQPFGGIGAGGIGLRGLPGGFGPRGLPGFGSRFDPFGRQPRPAEKPETRIALGRRTSKYKITKVQDDLVFIAMQFRLETLDDKDEFASLVVENSGELVFDRKLKVFKSKKVKGSIKLKLGSENLDIPTQFSYRHIKQEDFVPSDGVLPASKSLEPAELVDLFLETPMARLGESDLLKILTVLGQTPADSVDEAKLAPVKTKLAEVVASDSKIARKSAIEVLLSWDPVVATPFVISEYKRAGTFSRRSWISKLGKTGHADAAKLLADALKTGRTRSIAANALMTMGDVAEQAVLDVFGKSADRAVQTACLDVLEKVSTSAAIGPVKSFQESNSWAESRVERIVRAAESRGK